MIWNRCTRLLPPEAREPVPLGRLRRHEAKLRHKHCGWQITIAGPAAQSAAASAAAGAGRRARASGSVTGPSHGQGLGAAPAGTRMDAALAGTGHSTKPARPRPGYTNMKHVAL
jgi:hypothetical protein